MNTICFIKNLAKPRYIATIVFSIMAWCLATIPASAKSSAVELAVWVNEAIISTYTFDYEHFIPQEKEIAKYFTSEGWVNYSNALQESKLPTSIQTNSYYVSAVATMPPTIKTIQNKGWEATMPILVIYKNPAYKQKQSLLITVNFIKTTTQGVRGYAITSLKSAIITPPCRCAKKEPTAAIV
ncbi:MAG: DotI/IcmL family type IV secretion protein [Legionellaceae bacterium]|nr:DotI/IcmL family type IV secretion protein [Legionellaceae bacterium]